MTKYSFVDNSNSNNNYNDVLYSAVSTTYPTQRSYDKIAYWLTEYGRARRENIWLLLYSVCTFVCMLGPYVLTIFSRPALPVSQ